jgi:hypothetical protein
MRFSVVIPLYNKAAYIARSVRSVLAQTHAELQVIVVDDGSTDQGGEIVASIKDSRIRLVRQSNKGVSAARNLGVRQAGTEWVAFLDADDEYAPDFLSCVASLIGRYPGAKLSMIGANYAIGGPARIAVWPLPQDGVYDYFRMFTDQRSPCNSSSTVVNKQAFLSAGGFPEGVKQFEDWTAWFKMALIGEFGFIGRPLSLYHTVEGSVAHSDRSAVAMCGDAERMIRSVLGFAESVAIAKRQMSSVHGCMSEFAVNMAAYFAHKSEKRLALAMLRHVRMSGLLRGRWGHVGLLAKHMAVPAQIKGAYRSLRAKQKQGNTVKRESGDREANGPSSGAFL